MLGHTNLITGPPALFFFTPFGFETSQCLSMRSMFTYHDVYLPDRCLETTYQIDVATRSQSIWAWLQ